MELDWLCEAKKSGDPVYPFLNSSRNVRKLDKYDDNLAAAERYMEGFEGFFGKAAITFQTGVKLSRRLPGADRVLGRNGSKPESATFIQKWGYLGVDDRKDGKPIRLPSDCECEAGK